MTRLTYPATVLVLVTMLTASRSVAFAQEFQNVEYELKAGYFAYFGSLVTWPKAPFDGADKEFVIALLGEYPFGKQFQPVGQGYRIAAGTISVNQIRRKTIIVHYYRSISVFNERFRPCHVLFVCRSADETVPAETAQQRLDAALKRTRGTGVLTVAEAEGQADSRELLRHGAVVSYWNDAQSNRVKMFINRKAQQREGLEISSQLLGLRGIVTPVDD